ncbi:MAG: GGDEF domain-containing protein [Halieaceae bacterium]
MEQILPESWAIMHYGLILSLTCAQMMVVYSLSDSSNPPAGLGLFTVYFMAALLGWIAFTLQQGSTAAVGIDVPSVAAIINSFILFLACGQRAQKLRGRYTLGFLCVLASLSAFFLPGAKMFIIQALASGLFFGCAGALCAWRAWRYRNIGDAIIAFAAGMMIVGMPLSAYQALIADEVLQAQTIAFGVHSSAYVLVAIGFLASVLIEYQRHLSHLATEDPLTRLLNRRGLGDALHVSLAAAARHGYTTSAIMVDIDHFKQVNDSFGHDVGDHVIQLVARILTRMCRSSDVVARTGGEEFLLVLPNTDLAAAKSLAERIRVSIGEFPLLVDQQRIQVTASLGVSCASGQADLDLLYQEADRAMYLAKRGGRNRVASVEHNPLQIVAGGEQG